MDWKTVPTRLTQNMADAAKSVDARLSVWKYDDAYQAMLAHAPEAPTNHDVAQLQARVAELEAALRGVTSALDQMGDQPDRLVCPDVWRRLNCEELVTRGKEALGAE